MPGRKGASERFPLRLPTDLDAEIREIAKGDAAHPPSTINDTIVYLLREALRVRKERAEKSPGPMFPALLHAA